MDLNMFDIVINKKYYYHGIYTSIIDSIREGDGVNQYYLIITDDPTRICSMIESMAKALDVEILSNIRDNICLGYKNNKIKFNIVNMRRDLNCIRGMRLNGIIVDSDITPKIEGLEHLMGCLTLPNVKGMILLYRKERFYE